jgi:hypothetical protein
LKPVDALKTAIAQVTCAFLLRAIVMPPGFGPTEMVLWDQDLLNARELVGRPVTQTTVGPFAIVFVSLT